MRRTSRNLLHVVGGELLLRLANIGVAVLIGRVYGVVLFGIYAAILAAATLAERLADNGLEMSGIAEGSRHPGLLDRIATALYLNKTAFSLLAIGALAGVGWAMGLSRSHWPIATLLTLRTFLYSYCRLNAGFLKALDRTQQIARIQFAHFLVLCVVIFFVYLSESSFPILLFCLLMSQFAEFILSFWALRRFGVRLASVSVQSCLSLARRSTPIGLTYTISTLMLRGDLLVLSLLANVGVVGAFAAADTGLVMVYVVAWLFSGVLLADLGRLSPKADEFDSHFRRCLNAILLICIPLSIAATLLAPLTIRLLYGGSFDAAGLPAAIMCAAVPLIFLNAAFLSRAVARNAASTCLTIYGVGAAFSLILNFFLGWRYGMRGIAISIVLRELGITLAFLRLKNWVSAPVQAASAANSDSAFAEVLNA